MHNTEGFSIFATALETAQFIEHFHILEPVLDPKLFLEEVTVLAFMLAERFNLLVIFLRDINVVIRRCHTVCA